MKHSPSWMGARMKEFDGGTLLYLLLIPPNSRVLINAMMGSEMLPLRITKSESAPQRTER